MVRKLLDQGLKVQWGTGTLKLYLWQDSNFQCCQIVQVAISVLCRIQQCSASAAGSFGATSGCKNQCVGAWRLQRSRELTKLAVMVLPLLVLVMFLIKILSELCHRWLFHAFMWTVQALFKLEDQNGPVERQCLSQRIFSAGWGQKGALTISMAQMRSCGGKILKALAKVREKKSERGRNYGSVVSWITVLGFNTN